jgi:DNA-binding transcriptional MerR regulator
MRPKQLYPFRGDVVLMLRIGDFSKLSQVSIRTLRYYDSEGLLKPQHIDPATGYRYYTVEQLAHINRIVALKDLGFALDQIQQFLQADVSIDRLNDLLADQECELQQRIAHDQQRLERVRARIQQMKNQNHASPLDVVLKTIDPVWIVGNRLLVPTADDIDFFSRHMFDEIYRWLHQHRLDKEGQRMTLYHADEYIERDFDMEVMVVLPQPPQPCPPLPHSAMTVRQLPALPLAATTLHQGVMREVSRTSFQLMQWIVQSDYRFPTENMGMRELFLFDRFIVHDMNAEGIVELQIPVEPPAP